MERYSEAKAALELERLRREQHLLRMRKEELRARLERFAARRDDRGGG
ncbi:hypothetical protein [Sphingomonas crocodyli]|nr:hypothetical protein [Sphingomonas crocodyli]